MVVAVQSASGTGLNCYCSNTLCVISIQKTVLSMDLVDIDPRLVGQGPMSHVSYDSHVVTRQRMVDEMPRVGQQQQGEAETYDQAMMEGEIQRVSRELYKAFSGMNQGFAEVSVVKRLELVTIMCVFRQRTRSLLMSCQLTPISADRRPYIHTR